jgi:hypothetical protein
MTVTLILTLDGILFEIRPHLLVLQGTRKCLVSTLKVGHFKSVELTIVRVKSSESQVMQCKILDML